MKGAVKRGAERETRAESAWATLLCAHTHTHTPAHICSNINPHTNVHTPTFKHNLMYSHRMPTCLHTHPPSPVLTYSPHTPTCVLPSPLQNAHACTHECPHRGRSNLSSDSRETASEMATCVWEAYWAELSEAALARE